MSEADKNAFPDLADKANGLIDSGREDTILAIVGSYLAGKEAGKLEAEQEKPGE